MTKKNTVTVEFEGKTYKDVPSYLELAEENVSGYLMTKAMGGDVAAASQVVAICIDALPEGEFKELAKSVSQKKLQELLPAWVGTDQGKS